MKKISKLLCLIATLGLPVSLLVTTSGCAGDRYHRSTGAYLDDKAISSKVKTEMMADPAVKASQVHVKTFQGKVQLSGFVDTEGQKERAADIARRVRGVEWVKNDIVVKNALPGAAAGAEVTPSGTQTQPLTPEQQREQQQQVAPKSQP